MDIAVILGISKTHLLARLRQSVIAALGVTFGITMFITLVSFMTGLNGMLDGLVTNRTPHILLYNKIKPSEQQPLDKTAQFSAAWNIIHSVKPVAGRKEIYNALPIMQALREDERVLDVAPKVRAQVFYNAGDIEVNGVVNGVDVLKEAKMFFLGEYVTEGNLHDIITTNNAVLLGKGVAEKMLLAIGDVVQVTTAKGDILPLKVVGFYQSGLADVDDIQSFASLSTTQKLLGESNSYITELQVKLKDMTQAPALAKEYARTFGIDALDIQTANAQFETGTQVRNTITYAVSITLLIVAGFGIYNILNMMIYEKMDDIAILKATGFSGRDVKWIFIIQAMIIGIVGGALGLVFGYLLSSVIDHAPFETQALPTIKTYPVNFDPKYYIIGIVFALATTYLAGLFPARKASKIDPVEIIRGK
jgi:lipoprotein-releasing system permease protein